MGPRFYRNGRVGGEVSSTFLNYGVFDHFGPNLENYFGGSFLVLVHIVDLRVAIVLSIYLSIYLSRS